LGHGRGVSDHDVDDELVLFCKEGGFIVMAVEVAGALFSHFESTGLEYAVVGDSRDYGQSIPSDLDIIVDPGSLNLARTTIAEFCAEHRLALVQSIQHEANSWYYAIAWRDRDGQLSYLHPDIGGDYYRNGRLLLRARDALESCVSAPDTRGRASGFKVPAPAHAFIYYLLKRIDKGALAQQQGEYLSHQWSQDPEGARAQLKRWWNDEHVNMLATAAASDRWSTVVDALPGLAEEIRNRAPVAPRAYVKESVRVVRRIAHPTGFWVAFLGPDGSGKTTVISHVRDQLAPAFRRTRRCHLRPHLEVRNPREGVVVTDPHAQPPRDKVTSTLKLVYWWFDYSLGYLVSILPALIRSTLVLFDRYYDDLEVDPRRYRYDGSTRLARQLGRTIPRPNLIVVLDLPSTVAQERKREVPREEIERQRTRYRDIAQRHENGHLVDASRPVEEVVRDVTQLILDALKRRLAITS
jgi:thymidylate kinase